MQLTKIRLKPACSTSTLILGKKERGKKMKLFLQEDKSLRETIIEITYNVLDRRVEKLMEIVRSSEIQLEGKKDGLLFSLDIQDLYYMESVDQRTFLYKEKQVFESSERLYALEEKLAQTSFIRINKSTLLNMDYLKCVQPLSNYRLEATLANDEKLIISRHYLKKVKQYLKI